MIHLINESWGWKGFKAIEILDINEFGNVIFRSVAHEIWRLCPEEVSCERIALNEEEFEKLKLDDDFLMDWNMRELVEMATLKLGKLDPEEKYCLKVPSAVGGSYDESNLAKISFEELISFSGNIAKQIENLPDGQEIRLKFK